MENTILISTSTKSYIEGSKLKLARRFAYYIATHKSQSLLYPERDIFSLPHTYMEGIDDPDLMADKIQQELTTMLNNYYLEVDVMCEVQMEDDSRANIAIYADVTEKDGTTYGLGNVVAIDPTGLGQIVDINNYGEKDRYLGKLNYDRRTRLTSLAGTGI